MELLEQTVTLNGPFTCTQRPGRGLFLSVQADGAAITAARAVYAFPFQEGDRLFLNGYQSWTLSRETGVRDYDKSMRFCPGFLDRKYGFSAYGDSTFYPHPYRAGVQHGYSYAYVRRGETYYFFGSLAERVGFTRIIFDTNGNTVTFERDCIGRLVTGTYTVFDLYFQVGTEDEVFDGWFAALGVTPRAAEKLTGYTSWYNYYEHISEQILLRDAAGMSALASKPDLFQIDDGYETAVGDWLSIDQEKFPHGLAPVVKAIQKNGCRAGIWLAPFVCETKSALFREHPDWLVKGPDGKPVFGGGNWSGMYALDLYNQDFRAYLQACFQHFRAMGFTLFKLDFLYAVCMVPRPRKTRGEIMAEAIDLLRELCGDCAILGCGVPLASAFGQVEFCRIGMDMSLRWDDSPFMRPFHAERPSTKHTMLNTLYRRQLSGRAFLNDPDVFLLRETNCKLKPAQKQALAQLNCLLGGVLFTSDNFSDYTPEQKQRYQELIALREGQFLSCREEHGTITVSYLLNGAPQEFSWSLSG
jgi:alpha-galactosidase